MRTRPRPLAVVLFVAFAPVAIAAPSRAQSSAEDPTTDMARTRFKEGVSFYDKGEYEQARASFLQAYALKKHPAVFSTWRGAPSKAGMRSKRRRTSSSSCRRGRTAPTSSGRTPTRAQPIAVEARAHRGRRRSGDRGDGRRREGGNDAADRRNCGGARRAHRELQGAGRRDGYTERDGARRRKGDCPFLQDRLPRRHRATPATSGRHGTPPGDETSRPRRPKEGPTKPRPRRHQGDVERSHESILAPPKNFVPASLWGWSRSQLRGGRGRGRLQSTAQNKANSTAAQIALAGGSTCTTKASPRRPIHPGLQPFISDNNQVKPGRDDRKHRGGGRVAALAAMVVYWLAADKPDDRLERRDDDTGGRASGRPSLGGLSLTGNF